MADIQQSMERPIDRTMAYFYDHATGEYRGMMPAHGDPISGKPMLPPYATFLRPPDTAAHSVAQFFGNNWIASQDYRGSYVANLFTKLIERVDAIGPIADKYMLMSEDDAKSIGNHPEYRQLVDRKLVQLDELGRAGVYASILRK
jgi:hypothetical protein